VTLDSLEATHRCLSRRTKYLSRSLSALLDRTTSLVLRPAQACRTRATEVGRHPLQRQDGTWHDAKERVRLALLWLCCVSVVVVAGSVQIVSEVEGRDLSVRSNPHLVATTNDHSELPNTAIVLGSRGSLLISDHVCAIDQWRASLI